MNASASATVPATVPAFNGADVPATVPDAAAYVGRIGGKRDFVNVAKACGMTRGDADKAFALALGAHRSVLTARAGALIGSGHFVATSEKVSKSGLVRYTFKDTREDDSKAAAKAAAKVAKLEAALAAARAKLANV